MARYILPFLIVALCLASAGVSEKKQQQEDIVTSVVTVGSHGPSRLSKMPRTIPRGLSPEEEEKAIIAMNKEEERARQRFLEESKSTSKALEKAKDALKAAEAKVKLIEKANETEDIKTCPFTASNDMPDQMRKADVSAIKNDPCPSKERAEKARAESEEAKAALSNAQQLLKEAEAMNTAAQTAVDNSNFVPVYNPVDGRSMIGGTGRRNTERDSAFWPTVMVNAVFLLLVVQALIM